MHIPEEVLKFFERQNFVIVNTLDPEHGIHAAAKGIAVIDPAGEVFVTDLYMRHTHQNLSQDSRISLTAVDEKAFIGYCLQGHASIISHKEIPDFLNEAWEKKIILRMSQRVMHGVQGQARSGVQHEAHLPVQPQYVIKMKVEHIVDMSPPGMRHSR